jgi:hypothetical protein
MGRIHNLRIKEMSNIGYGYHIQRKEKLFVGEAIME